VTHARQGVAPAEYAVVAVEQLAQGRVHVGSLDPGTAAQVTPRSTCGQRGWGVDNPGPHFLYTLVDLPEFRTPETTVDRPTYMERGTVAELGAKRAGTGRPQEATAGGDRLGGGHRSGEPGRPRL
jgi:hypothetical protein